MYVYIYIHIAGGSSRHTSEVVKCGAIPVLVDRLDCANKSVSNQCIWAIGNIAGDCLLFSNMIINAGGIQRLKLILIKCSCLLNVEKNESEIEETIRIVVDVAWTILNLCRHDTRLDKINLDDVICCIIHLLSIVVRYGSIHLRGFLIDIVRNCLWTIGTVCASHPSNYEDIFSMFKNHGVLKLVACDYLSSTNDHIRLASLSALSSIIKVSKRNEMEYIVLELDCLKILSQFLTPKNGNRETRYSCQLLSGITKFCHSTGVIVDNYHDHAKIKNGKENSSNNNQDDNKIVKIQKIMDKIVNDYDEILDKLLYLSKMIDIVEKEKHDNVVYVDKEKELLERGLKELYPNTQKAVILAMCNIEQACNIYQMKKYVNKGLLIAIFRVLDKDNYIYSNDYDVLFAAVDALTNVLYCGKMMNKLGQSKNNYKQLIGTLNGEKIVKFEKC